MRLKKTFFNRNTLEVSEELLGCVLCNEIDGKILKGKIVETEAYNQDDPASITYNGRFTPSTEIMYKSGGHIRAYMTYGMHVCINIVTEPKGIGAGVLIRALEPVENIDNSNGPAKLCKAMAITVEYNKLDITQSKSNIWIEQSVAPAEIIKTTRIGIKQAIEYPWRFYIKDNKWVSKI